MDYLIEVVDYDPNWSLFFEQEKALILKTIADTIADIQHIGSTSVPGLAAKPFIDILVGVHTLPPTADQKQALETIGYFYQWEIGDHPGQHFYFRKTMPQTYHLHWVQQGSEAWEKHILFRDFLRTHPDLVIKYETLKRELAVQFKMDRVGYVTNKAPLINDFLEQAKVWKNQHSFSE